MLNLPDKGLAKLLYSLVLSFSRFADVSYER